MPDITYDVGRVSFIMKGAWNLATNYEKLDAVSYDGSLYIAKQDVPGGTSITNTTYWQLAAEKGDKGDTGGVNSVNGQQGDVWFPDSRQLISDGYTTDTEPFLMKGNDSDSDRFELAKKLGNTGAVNQYAKELNSTNYLADSSSVSFSDGVATITASARYGGIHQDFNAVPVDHKVFMSATIKLTTASNQIQFLLQYFGGTAASLFTQATTNEQIVSGILSVTGGTATRLAVRDNRASDRDAFTVKNIRVIDLTLWFGSNDRIPSGLLAHPENWGRYYAGSLAYNAGTLESADGTVLKSIGRNLFDKSTAKDSYYISGSTGAETANADFFCSDYIEVIPNTAYYTNTNVNGQIYTHVFFDGNKNFISANAPSDTNFTTPATARYMRVNAKKANITADQLVESLYYSGESGYSDYYPYSVLAEVDTGSEVLRGVEGSRDEKLPSGAITRNRAVADLSTLAWTWNGTYGVYITNDLASEIKKPADNNTVPTLISNKYIPNSVNAASTVGNVIVLQNNAVWVYATSGDVPSGMLEYPLATPTTEQGTAYNPIVATVKCGVLSWTQTKGIPVGQESHWFENLRKRVEDRLPDPPSADGTYRLTCTISGGVKTYSWEA